MIHQHLSPNQVEIYSSNQIDANVRAEMDEHLATCALCRTRVAKIQKIDTALRKLPREDPPPGFADLIVTAVEWRAGQEQQRRERMPFIALATGFSILLTLWFGVAGFVAFQDNGVLDFLTLYTTHSDVSFSLDALLALLEALPFTEILLTLFALITAGVLGQNLVESVRPHMMELGKHS